MIKRWNRIVSLFFSLLILGCQSKMEDNSIAARVGNSVLTKDEVKENLIAKGLTIERENEYIEKWINDELLVQEARKQGLDRSPEIRSQLRELEKELLIHKLVEKVFSEKIQFSDEKMNEEMKSFYEKNKDLFSLSTEEARIQVILTKTQEEANQILKEIRAGKEFEVVAKERSIDSFREAGGDMGFIKKSDVISDVSHFAFSLPEGSVSPVFHSSYGFHIIKVIKRYKGGDIKEFRDAKDDILQRLRVNKERTIYLDLLYQLQNKYKVYVASSQDQVQQPTGNAK